MNRADQQRAKKRRREVLIHQLQERNQELHEKIVRLRREFGSNKRVIEEL
jgi:flagellar biosynthesis/type III secretory pathway chaperone